MPLRSSGFSSAVLQAVGFGFHAIRPETRSHYARKGHTETSRAAPPPATHRRPTAKSHKGASGKRRSERPRRHAFGRASRRRAGSESARTAAFSGFPPESLSWDLKIKFAVPSAGCHDCLYPFLELRPPADRKRTRMTSIH